MRDNYHDTVYRMYESSDILYKNQQWFNANYLAGYVLECYCKLILLMASQQGYSYSGHRHNVKEFKHNVNELKEEVELINLRGGLSAGYCLDVQSVCTNLLNSWNPNKRYEADSGILNNEALALRIHNEVEAIMDLIIKMEIDGVLV